MSPLVFVLLVLLPFVWAIQHVGTRLAPALKRSTSCPECRGEVIA